MNFDRRVAKERAKQLMRDTKPSPYKVTILYILMTSVTAYVVSQILNAVYGDDYINFFIGSPSLFNAGLIGAFLFVFLELYQMVVGFGYTIWALSTWRRENTGFGTLMDGFGIVGSVIMLEIQIALRVFGWSLLLGFGCVFGGMLLSLISSTLAMAVISVFAIACVTMLTLRYSMVYFVMADQKTPNPSMAIQQGVALMRGKMGELLKLYLSFAGWYLLIYGLSIFISAVGLSLSNVLDYSILATGNVQQFYTQMQMALADMWWLDAISTVVSWAVSVIFLPYMQLTIAGFYQSLVQNDAPLLLERDENFDF